MKAWSWQEYVKDSKKNEKKIRRHRGNYFIVLLSRPTWAFWINRGTSWMSFLQKIFSFLPRRHFLRRSVTNDMVFKASAAETLNKCSRIVGSFKRQELLHGSCLPCPFSKSPPLIEPRPVPTLLIGLLSLRRSLSRLKKNSAEWSLSTYTYGFQRD